VLLFENLKIGFWKLSVIWDLIFCAFKFCKKMAENYLSVTKFSRRLFLG